MPKGFAPFAVNRNIPPGSNDPAITPRVAILHVDAGNAESLYDFFKNRSGGIESHFHVRRDGVVEQYRSIYFQADANLDANDFAVSIETQGFGDGVWTEWQIQSIKKLLLWLHEEAGIPLRKCDRWDGSGVGYHTLFGSPSHWTPVAKSCPGPKRIQQFDAVLVPWMRTAVQLKTTLTLATANLNFGRSVERQQAILDDIGADVVFTQEDVRGGGRERVILRGSARRKVELLSSGKVLAARNLHGMRIRRRNFAYKDVEIPGVGEVRLVCAHIAPRRMPVLRPIYHARLRKLIRGRWFIVGGDWNERRAEDPADLKARRKARWYGKRIDSFAVHPSLVKYVKRSRHSEDRRDGHPTVYLEMEF